jgi:pimeloyl-ACP methyl ester carboxylesterase
VIGRPIPDDPADAERLMHPRAMAAAVSAVLDALAIGPVAIEAESGGGRISMWLAVDRPDLVSRLVLASVAAETPPDSPMAERLRRWIALAEAGDWGAFFAAMAQQMKAASEVEAGSFAAAARLQPRPATPERFIGELRATLDPTSFVTERLGEIAVPTLALGGEQDQVVPIASTRLVAARIPGARLVTDPECGHTVRTSFRGYDELVESFLSEGD